MGSPPPEDTASARRYRCCSSPLRSVISERSRLYNQLQALNVGAPATLRERIRPAKNGAKLAQRLTGMRTRPNASPQENTTLQVLRDIANRTRTLDQQAQDYTRQIDALTRELAPTLMHEPSIRPICAAKLIAFNPARFRSEAAFAHANGTAPQPASSGKTVRHRLSPGGDRQINTAIYTIALTLRPPRPEPRLHPTPNRGRQDQARSHEIPQATPPRDLYQLAVEALARDDTSPSTAPCKSLATSVRTASVTATGLPALSAPITGGNFGRKLLLIYCFSSAPGRIRTCDPRIRSPTLYPAELRGRMPDLGWEVSHSLAMIARPCRPGRSGVFDDPRVSSARGAKSVSGAVLRQT